MTDRERRAAKVAALKARTEARKAAGVAFGMRGATALSVPPPAPRPPCALKGRPLTGAEREALGLSHTKRWSLCMHEEQPLGAHVCPCSGCGPRCRGYEPGEE